MPHDLPNYGAKAELRKRYHARRDRLATVQSITAKSDSVPVPFAPKMKLPEVRREVVR